jgi:ligand-binding sensor domain-containing protein
VAKAYRVSHLSSPHFPQNAVAILWFFLVFLAAVSCASSHARSDPVPIWAIFTAENSDLPGDRIQALASSSDGFVWAATLGGGLARLDTDGRWRTFNNASTKGGLPSDDVMALASDPDGSLWVGTLGGLARLDKDGGWRTYTKANTHGDLPDDRIVALAIGPDRSIWVGTAAGLARLNKGEQWQTYDYASTRGSLPDNKIQALVVDHDGALWVGTGVGLARIDINGHWKNYSQAIVSEGKPINDCVMALAVGKDGSIWKGTLGGGLARLDSDGRWVTYTKAGAQGGLPNDDVIALAPDADGSLWVGTFQGLVRLSKDGQWQRYDATSNGGSLWVGNLQDEMQVRKDDGYDGASKGGLLNSFVQALAPASDGSIWVGTASGLARLDTVGRWQTYRTASTKGSLPDNGIQALAFDADGSLWVGTVAGLAHLEKDDRWQTYDSATTVGGLPNDDVLALAPDPDGSLWVGTAGGLAHRLKGGRWVTYTQANTKVGLRLASELALGPDGSVWIGGAGLARLYKGDWRTYGYLSTNGAIPSDDVRSLAIGSDGSLWVGTSRGLARLDQKAEWQPYSWPNREESWAGDDILLLMFTPSLDVRVVAPVDEVQALATAPDGTVWAGTRGDLRRLEKDGSWKSYTSASTRGALPNDNVHALALDPDGSLWVGTEGGLARLDKDGQWQTYSQSNTTGGLPDNRVLALALGPDESIWVGTSDPWGPGRKGGGLGHLSRPVAGTIRIVDVVGKVGEVTQRDQTVAVTAFDPSYLTQPGMFRYVWSLTESGSPKDRTGSEITTRSSLYRATFDHDGTYRIRAVAVDRFGNRSEPRDINFKVTLPKPPSYLETLAAAWKTIVAVLTGLYIFAFVVLVLLTRRYPLAFRILNDEVWAKLVTWPFFFLRHVPAIQRWVLEPWFQEVRRSTPKTDDVQFFPPPVSTNAGSRSEGTALLQRLRDSPRLWLYGRSGMGKSSVFASWRRAYFAAEDALNLSAAVRRYGFVPIMLPVRHYASLPIPDANRPESWVLESVRRQLEEFGFATRDLGLIDAMLKAGQIALALDGINEADRDSALAAFSRQYAAVRLLVTSSLLVEERRDEHPGLRWEVWRLPPDIIGLRSELLGLWLGHQKAAILDRRILAEGLSDTLASGYDLRLLADLAEADPEHVPLPADRTALYRAMLTRARGPDGQPLRLEGLKKVAWSMVTERRRNIQPDDEKLLGVGTLQALEKEGLRIIQTLGAGREFRHDQMRAFLAALWLVEETPTPHALQMEVSDAGAFALNRRDQEELWRFVASMLSAAEDIEALWLFADEDPAERAILLAALQVEADNRGVTLVRAAQTPKPEAA